MNSCCRRVPAALLALAFALVSGAPSAAGESAAGPPTQRTGESIHILVDGRTSRDAQEAPALLGAGEGGQPSPSPATGSPADAETGSGLDANLVGTLAGSLAAAALLAVVVIGGWMYTQRER